NSMLGACHACANPLTAHYGMTHGLAIGIMLPHIIRYNAPAAGTLYADLMEQANLADGAADAADVIAERVAQLMRRAGLPLTLSDCGVAETILPVLAEEANKQWTARFNPRPVANKELLALYRAAM